MKQWGRFGEEWLEWGWSWKSSEMKNRRRWRTFNGGRGYDNRIGLTVNFKCLTRLVFGNKMRQFSWRSTGQNQDQKEAVTNLISTQRISCLERDEITSVRKAKKISVYQRGGWKGCWSHPPLKLCNYFKQMLFSKIQIQQQRNWLAIWSSQWVTLLLLIISGKPSIHFKGIYANFITEFFNYVSPAWNEKKKHNSISMCTAHLRFLNYMDLLPMN